jgi:aspartyl-tRNA(Asn)/glutamyl-tRNA(Gln) amidotransferase subunit A
MADHRNQPKDPLSSLVALSEEIRTRRLSPVDVVGSILERIKALDEDLNAFVTLLPDRALEQAARAEREICAGEYRGPLHGVPVAVKDIIFTEGVRTTMGSHFFRDYVPHYSATVVEYLEAAGAIIIGKANTHEFAYGGTGDRSFFGAPRNPRNTSRITGGSSGGSGAAVAAGLVWGAVGSDTGGSIRIPASLCGIVGMKPTFGRVSKHGVFPLAWTLDHVGPMTRTVEDNALMLSVLAAHDPRDPYSVDLPGEDFARDMRAGVKGGVVGVPSTHYFDRLDPEVEQRVRAAAEVFWSLGAKVRQVEVPLLHETLLGQRLTMAAEAYAIHEERLKSGPDRFDPEVRDRLLEGESLRAHRYATAQQVRRRSREAFVGILSEVDVLITPTTAIPATPLGVRTVRIKDEEELVRSALNRLTGPTSLNGLPSLSMPCGVTSERLPVGLQVIGRPYEEANVYRYAYAYEEAADLPLDYKTLAVG